MKPEPWSVRLKRFSEADLGKSNWDMTDRDQGNFEFKMMVFLWFNEDVNLRERKRVQLDIQQALIRSPVEIHGGIVRATLDISLDKRLWTKAQAVFLCAMREFAGLRSETFDIRWVSTGTRVLVNSAPAGCGPVLSQEPLEIQDLCAKCGC